MRRIVTGIVAIAVVVGGLGWALWPRDGEAAYVVAAASRGTVAQQLTLVGPVERENQAVLSYDSPGIVTGVGVRVGDQVVAGQPIATLDAAPLRLSVLQARATLAQAEAQLDADLTARDAGTSGSTVGLPAAGGGAGAGTGGTATGGGTGQPGASGSGETPGLPGGADQLGELTRALESVRQAVTHQQQVCTPVFTTLQRLRELGTKPSSLTDLPLPDLPRPTAGTSTTGVPTTTAPSAPAAGAPPADAGPVNPGLTTTASSGDATSSSPTPNVTTPTAEASAGPSGEPAPTASGGPTTTQPTGRPTDGPTSLPDWFPTEWPDDLPIGTITGFFTSFEECSTAMGQTAQAEAVAAQAIGAASQALAQANQQADAALTQARAELEEAAKRAAEEAVRQAQAQIAEQLARLSGGAVTDATIARDRATVLDARQRLETAEINLAAATLTTPVGGTVGALDLVVGESSAGRSVTIVGAGAARIQVEVPLAHRVLVMPGTSATIGQLASGHTLAGQVHTLSVLPSSGAAPTYTAQVLTDDADQTLPAGSWAEATLSLRTAADVLTVPASAVTKITDTTGTVQVAATPRATTADTVTVVTGSVGGGRVEIVSGLREGQWVVLADRRVPVPGGLAQYQPLQRSGGGASPTPNR